VGRSRGTSTGRSEAEEGFLHCLGSLALDLLDDLGVNTQRDPGIIVAETGLSSANVNPTDYQGSG